MNDVTTVKLRYGNLHLEDIPKCTPDTIVCEQNETNEAISRIREKLSILVASNPKDLMSKNDYEDYSDVMSFITAKVDEVLYDAQESYSRLERLSILETILDEWSHDPYFRDDNTGIFDKVDFKDNEQIQTFVYPSERKDETVNQERIDVEFHGKPYKSNSFEEIYDGCKKNIAVNHLMEEQINGLVLVYVDGKVFVTNDGQFAFKNETEAMDTVMSQMDPSILHRMYNGCIVGQPENAKKFYDDVVFYLNEEDGNFVRNFIENLASDDTKYMLGSPEYSKFYELAKTAFNKYVMKHHIKFVRLDELY